MANPTLAMGRFRRSGNSDDITEATHLRRDRPEIARILTQRMESLPFARIGAQSIAVRLMALPISNVSNGAKQTVSFALVRYSDGIQVEKVFRLFHKEEQMLPRTREAILDAGGHVVRLVPDDIVAENPSALTHRDGETRRNLT